MNLYTYRADLERVVDGDTVDLKVDLGFSLSYSVRFRLARIVAPEKKTEGLKDNMAATIYLNDLLAGTLESIYVASISTPEYRRWLGELYIGSFLDDGTFDGYNVNETMVRNGYALYREY